MDIGILKSKILGLLFLYLYFPCTEQPASAEEWATSTTSTQYLPIAVLRNTLELITV